MPVILQPGALKRPTQPRACTGFRAQGLVLQVSLVGGGPFLRGPVLYRTQKRESNLEHYSLMGVRAFRAWDFSGSGLGLGWDGEYRATP